MRYGISLQYNKYDHVFLQIPFLDELKDFVLVNIKLNFWK